jgi:orotidine-5'-phosphate decarboxylase
MDQLIVALDVDTRGQAMALADGLRDVVGGFKIGSRLFTGEGPAVLEELAGRGDRVFLDLKFHDIPHTVAGAVSAATRRGAWMVTVHAAGGLDMMRAAREAATEEAARRSRQPPIVVAVTVLTSLGDATLPEVGIHDRLDDQVVRLAALARSAGLDGVVAAAREIPLIRQRCGKPFAIVAPGIRGEGDVKGDQTRTMSAPEALAAGATYLVVGRPIIDAPEPRAAAERLVSECRAAETP